MHPSVAVFSNKVVWSLNVRVGRDEIVTAQNVFAAPEPLPIDRIALYNVNIHTMSVQSRVNCHIY